MIRHSLEFLDVTIRPQDVKPSRNQSTMKAHTEDRGAFGVTFGKTMFDTVVGAVEMDEAGVYYEPTFFINAENVADYLN